MYIDQKPPPAVPPHPLTYPILEYQVPARGNPEGPNVAPFQRVCPPGSFVTAFYGRAGSRWIHALGPLFCSDGTTLKATNGAAGGITFGDASPRGYSGASVSVGTADSGIGVITSIILNRSTTALPLYGVRGSVQLRLACPEGAVVAGVYGNASAGQDYKY